MKAPVFIFWFRRDLRFEDNVGLYHALYQAKLQGLRVIPVFIFDKNILDKLEDKKDRRVDFIHRTILSMQEQLVSNGKSMLVEYGKPLDVMANLTKQYNIASVYTNHDYEPLAMERDAQIKTLLDEKGISFQTNKDQVIF
jgi:deoxyribodipyrimidine photo-lyase